MNEYVNLYSAQLEKTSRALAAKQMGFKFFSRKCISGQWWSPQIDGEAVPCGGAATSKSPRPIVVLVRGTTSAPLLAVSCHLPTTDETGVYTSAKYNGARPWRHLKMIIASLKVVTNDNVLSFAATFYVPIFGLIFFENVHTSRQHF